MPIIELIGGVGGLFLVAYLLSKKKPDTRLADAEAYIRSKSSLYRNYHISETRRLVKQWQHVAISDQEAIDIVQRIRSEQGLGPIKHYNMPGYVEE